MCNYKSKESFYIIVSQKCYYVFLHFQFLDFVVTTTVVKRSNIFFQVFYLRVGEGELSVTYLPDYVLHYVLKNTQNLAELVIIKKTFN